MSRRFAVAAVCVALIALVDQPRAAAQILNSEQGLFDLIVITSDLSEATRQMTTYDLDEDGRIDRRERERLPWEDEWETFDLNRDGKLTHLEIAVRQAKLRGKDDITEFDLNNVQTFLRRYDSNRNGRLEPDEIEQGGWPSQPEDYDGNGDGTLTTRELATRFAFNRGLRREMGIEAVDNVGANRFLSHFDQDGDKKLDANERAGAPLPKAAEPFDDDGDGKLGAMELATMLAKHRRDAGLTKPDTHKVRRIFETWDSDFDGKIELAVLPVVNGSGNPFGGIAPDALKQFDSDKDGVVTIKEVETVFAEIRKERGYTEVEFTKAKKMMTRYDQNRSRSIEPSELFDSSGPAALPKNLVTEADRDGDGRVNVDELARYFVKTKK